MRHLLLDSRLIEDPSITRNEVPTNFNNAADIQVESGNLQSNMERDYLNQWDHPFEYNCPNGNYCFKLIVTENSTKKADGYL